MTKFNWHQKMSLPLLVSASLSFGACASEEGAAPGAPMHMQMMEVGVHTVSSEDIDLRVELPGRTSPFLVAEVRPQVGGLIFERLFQEGSDVEEGEVLYKIDPSNYEVALSLAKANLQRAQALSRTNSRRATRINALAKTDTASKQESDDATGAVLSARADVAAAQAALEKAELDLERTEVRAPIRGRVERQSMMPGALVTAYQSRLAVVQQLDPIYVDLTRPSAEVLKWKRALASGKLARVGDGEEAARVSLQLEDGSAYPHEGRLEFADATVNPNTSTITLRAVFPNPDAELLPGMYVRALLSEGVVEDATIVPQSAVAYDQRGRPIVYVVDGEGMVDQRSVVLERAVGPHWYVSDGVSVGEQVVVKGLQRTRAGIKVKAVQAGLEGAEDQGSPEKAAPEKAAPEKAAPEKAAGEGEPELPKEERKNAPSGKVQ